MPRGRSRAIATLASALLVAGALTVGSSSPAGASALQRIPCYWSVGYAAPAYEVMSGELQLPGNAGTVDIGTGAIDWNIATKHGLAWAKNFMSLAWVLGAVYYYVTRGESDRQAHLDRAEQIASDFVAHIPIGGGPEPQATWSAMYVGERAQVFSCLAYVDPSFTPAFRELRAMGPWLANQSHDPGNSNQGLVFRLGGLAAGCTTNNATWADLARDKLGALASSAIDSQGVPYEQSVGYGSRDASLFTTASNQLTVCLGTAATILTTRLHALQRFLAWATEPDGTLTLLGDTSLPTSTGYCPVSGPAGPVPQTGTWKVFTGGYAFGRTTWNEDPSYSPTLFSKSGYYSLRFGPGRIMHGHNDHESVTWFARSNPLLVDAGQYSVPSAFATYARTPQAHNVLVEPGVAFSPSAKTTLVRYRAASTWQSYELSDTAYGGKARVREVLFDLNAGIVVVIDRASRASAGPYDQLWHLAPPDAVSVARNGSAAVSTCDGTTTFWITPVALRGQVIALHSTGMVKGQMSPYQGWVDSAANDAVQAAPVINLHRTGSSATILTILTTGPHGSHPRIVRSWSSSSGYHFTITTNGVTRVIHLDGTGLLTEA